MQKTEDGDAREATSGREHKRRQDRDRQRNTTRQQTPTAEVFRGKHKDLQGSVYTYDSSARAYQYNKTTDAIAEWVKLNLKFPMDVWRVLTTLKDPDKKAWIPKTPTDDMDPEIKQMVMAESVKKYTKRLAEYEGNCCSVFTIVFGQCGDTLQAKLRGQEDWENTFEENNLLKLMKNIQTWMLNQEGSKCPSAAADAAMAALYRIRQNRHETLTEYRKRFRAATEVLEHMEVNL